MLLSLICRGLFFKEKGNFEILTCIIESIADITWHSIPTYVSIHDSSENKEK